MNRAPLIFLGAFLVLAFSWAGLVLTNQVGYGALAPHFDDTENKAFPGQPPGLAARGALVYQDLGCAYCHTQQVRDGTDVARKLGERASYARDYIRDTTVLLGDLRVGPDLRDFGARAPAAADLYLHLYAPSQAVNGSTMPPYTFLFETRKISGQPSPDALKVEVAPGTEVVPTERARVLVAYLLSLQNPYDYPEEKQKNFVPRPPKGTAAENKPEAPKK
jgi:cytochrome c oxidase cbb3-type subunit 2